MMIPKSIFVDPGKNGIYGCLALTLSLFVFAYSINFGQIAILAFYAVWLPLILVDYRFVLGGLWNRPVLLLLPLLACLSFFWSDAPSVTARSSLQYASHVVCAAIAARVLSAFTLTRGMLIGVCLVLLYSLAAGRYIYDPIDGEYGFVGAFPSKNQLGFYASIGAFFGFYHALFIGRGIRPKVVVLAVAAFSAVILIMSQSATSMLVTPVAIAAIVAGRGMGALSPGQRSVLLMIGTAIVALGLAGAFAAGAFESVLAAFGKDATLTGRTYLWDQGIVLGADTPVLGVGYQAFWVQGFSEAERLWAEFYIASRTGFHFHSTYIEAFVSLGTVGLLLVLIPFLSSLSMSIRLLVAGRGGHEPVLHLGLSVLLIARSVVEVDVLFPYMIGSFLLYLSWARLLELNARRPSVRQGRGGRLRMEYHEASRT